MLRVFGALMSAVSQNCVFSEQGIRKLENAKKLIRELPLPREPTGTSVYSKKLRIHLVTIIDYLIKNNNLSLLTNARSELKDNIDFLDDGKGSLMPDVFNEESLALAEILLETLNILKLSEDLTETAYTFSPINKVNSFIKQLIATLNFRIGLYRKLLEQSREELIFDAILENAKKLVQDLTKEPKQDEVKVIFNKYMISASHWLTEFEDCSFYRVNNAARYVNQEKPYRIKDTTLIACGHAFMLELIKIECEFNHILFEKTKMEAHIIRNFCINDYEPGTADAIQKNFTSLVTNFCKSAETYMTGNHLIMFKSVNTRKVEILDKAIGSIRRIDTGKPLAFKLFEGYQVLTCAESENAALALSKNQAPGELSKVIHQSQMLFLAIALNVKHTCDEKLYDYAKAKQNVSNKGHLNSPG